MLVKVLIVLRELVATAGIAFRSQEEVFAQELDRSWKNCIKVTGCYARLTVLLGRLQHGWLPWC